jgi:hypothetical protein
MFSELLALVALAGMAGTIGFAVALMLRRDAPTPPPAAERNLTDSFMLARMDARLNGVERSIERGGNISININMPQVRYATGAPEQQQLPEVRTPLYLPAGQPRHSLPDSKVQVIDWSTSDEYATTR